MSEKKIVICDIDGTIANNDHRQHFLEGKKDWDGFFSELYKDKPIFEIIDKVNSFSFNLKLIMRGDRDKRNKEQVKKELFFSNFKHEEVLCCFENDEGLIKMWKKINLKVINVNKIIN